MAKYHSSENMAAITYSGPAPIPDEDYILHLVEAVLNRPVLANTPGKLARRQTLLALAA
ncbi:hypothetical protein [Adhaeribacter arboris]|uniref:hypothetical protein n=1 Tax=Adhaeribacter arboris TaxID=2072846 RepID=UPI0013050542|nr:hypothetical protein [Adhaeribacter arboris]